MTVGLLLKKISYAELSWFDARAVRTRIAAKGLPPHFTFLLRG